MKVIALRGGESTGKSHTINIVYHFLLKDGYMQVPGHFRVLGNPNFEDVIDVLKNDRITIGIVGMGDYQRGEGSLSKLIKELEVKACDLVICSCRNNPKIENAVLQYPEHIFVEKTLSTGDSNNRVVNALDADAIIKLIPV